MNSKRKIVTRRLECNTERLYGTLDEAIKYLTEMSEKLPKDATLEEHWTEYEDMDLAFSWTSPETYKEYHDRLALEKASQEQEILKTEREAERQRDFKELDRLKKKLGVWG